MRSRGLVKSSVWLTCEVRGDLNRVIGTWNRNESVLLLIGVVLVLLGVLIRLILRRLLAVR